MSKWEEEDLHGARTLFNEISNDDLMPNELDHGFRKGKSGKSVGSDEIPNEVFAFIDRLTRELSLTVRNRSSGRACRLTPGVKPKNGTLTKKKNQ